MGVVRSDVAVAFMVTLVFFVVALVLMDRSVAVSIVAGAITGLFEGTLMFPLENLKIQQQLDGTGVAAALRRTLRHHGLAGLYRGLTPVLMGAIPTQAIRWGTFEAFCSVADCRDLGNVGIAAVISGVVNSLVTGVPVETLKISMIHADVASAKRASMSCPLPVEEVAGGTAFVPIGSSRVGGATEVRLETDSYTDVIAVASPIVSAHYTMHVPSKGRDEALGLRHSSVGGGGGGGGGVYDTPLGLNGPASPIGLGHHHTEPAPLPALGYRGWVPTVAKKIVNQAIRFPAHSWALRSLCRAFVVADASATSCRHNHPILNFIAGSIAGLSSIVLTQPLDVAKTRMQGLHGARYHNTLHCLRMIAADEGARAFLQGAGIRAFRTALGAGLTFSLFPWVQLMVASAWGEPQH